MTESCVNAGDAILPGQHNAQLVLTTNDPDRHVVRTALNLDVTGP